MTRSLALASLAAFALAGCPSNPTVDGGRDTPSPPGDTPPGDTPPGDTPPSDTPGGRTCSVGAMGCDVIAQNCTPEGMTARGCYIADFGMGVATQCVPSGTTSEGGTCTNVNDCAEGMTCQDGRCRELCCMGAATDCMVGYSCTPYADGMGGTLSVGVCEPPAMCTVIPNSGCAAGSACIPRMDGTLGCFMAGDNAEDEECGGAMGGCMPGLGCFGMTGGTFTCIAFCRLDMPTTCTAGHTCTEQPAVVGGGYGLCTPT